MLASSMNIVLQISKHRGLAGTKRGAGVDVNDARLGISYKGPWL